MSSETQSEKTPAPAVEKKLDNKTVFGPLGKYAVIAVVMVSIIVTTAIMLDRQLNTSEDKLAVIEDKVSQTYVAETQANSETVTAVTDETVQASTTETVEMATSTESGNEAAVIEVSTADVLVAPAPEATESTVASEAMPTEATPTDALAVKQQAHSTETTQFELARNTRQEQQQARIEAFKQQQKQHMTEMFARIKTLEAQQLEQYKNSQESQITRLREQIAQQQQQIEALVLRNKDRYDLREANVQRNQANREEMLNRI